MPERGKARRGGREGSKARGGWGRGERETTSGNCASSLSPPPSLTVRKRIDRIGRLCRMERSASAEASSRLSPFHLST